MCLACAELPDMCNNSNTCLMEKLREKNSKIRSSANLSIHVQQCYSVIFNKLSWTGGWAVGHTTHWPGILTVQSVHIMLLKKTVLMINIISCFCLLDPGAYRRKQNRMGWWSMSSIFSFVLMVSNSLNWVLQHVCVRPCMLWLGIKQESVFYYNLWLLVPGSFWWSYSVKYEVHLV